MPGKDERRGWRTDDVTAGQLQVFRISRRPAPPAAIPLINWVKKTLEANWSVHSKAGAASTSADEIKLLFARINFVRLRDRVPTRYIRLIVSICSRVDRAGPPRSWEKQSFELRLFPAVSFVSVPPISIFLLDSRSRKVDANCSRVCDAKRGGHVSPPPPLLSLSPRIYGA